MCVVPSLWLENNKLQDGDLSTNRQGRTTGASRCTRIPGWHVSYLHEGQQATVLQLPAQPKTAAEAKAQTRVVYVG